MHRRNIHLIALARQGDLLARREVGRRYLLGIDGIARHVPTGIAYLTHASLRGDPQAARIVVESLALPDIAQLGLIDLLDLAATTDSSVAKAKVAVWLLASRGREDEALRRLSEAAALGHAGARRAGIALHGNAPMPAVLRALACDMDTDLGDVAITAAQAARAAGDLDRLVFALDLAFAFRQAACVELDKLVVQAAQMAESTQRGIGPLPSGQLEASLDRRAHEGDSWAAYALGRALCGIDCGSIPATALAGTTAVRRGTALLFRAADAGWSEAWLHLSRLHADQRLSVANAQMALFCLEKAGHAGSAQAQTKLGALLLRSASALAATEQAIAWLHKACQQGDAHAYELLRSLHLPVEGSDAEARDAIEQVRGDHPWLALRMQLSRDFGLTKLEALCVDPVIGLRPWGLVVGKNPFIVQTRLAAPRAIPALTGAALDDLRRTASVFAELGREGALLEGDVRRRSRVQRRAFERFGIEDALFFAHAPANVLDTLRLGTRWAWRARTELQHALAA
jgi:TPR repeat protein